MPRRGPELQLGVPWRADLQEVVVPPIVEFEAGNRLRVAAVEVFSQPQDRGERANDSPVFSVECGELLVLPLRGPLSMIPRDECNRVDLIRLEAAQIAVLDQVVGMFVMVLVTDVHADIVQDCGVFEPLALAVGEAMDRAGLIEERQCEASDLRRVLGPELAALGKLEDAAAAHVGVPIGLCDLLAVSRDVVEHESFTQRQIAQRDLVGTEPPHDLLEQDRTGHRQVRPARLEARHAQPLFQRHPGELFPQSPELFCRDATVPKRAASAPVLGSDGDGSEA